MDAAVNPSQSKTKVLISLFLTEKYGAELRSILAESDVEAHYGLEVNYQVLLDFDSEITHSLVNSPLQMLPLFDSCLVSTLRSLHRPEEGLVAKSNCHMRFSHLLPFEELTMNVVPRLEHVGRFVSFSGTVVRTGAVKVLECEREFICNKCRERLIVKADYEQFHTIHPPVCCSTEGCNSLKFTQVEEDKMAAMYQDYQEIKLQEQVQHLEVGTMPHCLYVVLENDLADCCKPGDDVTITGVVVRRWKPLSVGSPCDLELVLMANHVQVNNNQRACVVVTEKMISGFEEFWASHSDTLLEGRNIILASFCPQIFGLYVVKLSICLALIGGVQCTDSSGTKIRGESHLLLVGDPGTGKSQFLKYAAKLIPRSVLTTGVGTTTAGLTVCAVKDEGEWQLEAGALVLSDGGLCCIDEFSSLREQDRASIHEAMEQQTISVAKAGMVCKLNTRCTVLAATNPKGSYDPDQPLSVNTALASPLLSRFDVVLILVDAYNETWDRVISEHILKQKQPNDAKSEAPAGNKMESSLEGMWSFERMQGYFAYVKTLSPTMTPEANQVLTRYYTLQRLGTHHIEARTTVRLLESLLRLAQAHAKLTCRPEVTLQDAVVAITVVECSMQGASLLGGINVLHSAFPEAGDEEYRVQEVLVLEKLGQSHLSRQMLPHPPATPTIQPEVLSPRGADQQQPCGDPAHPPQLGPPHTTSSPPPPPPPPPPNMASSSSSSSQLQWSSGAHPSPHIVEPSQSSSRAPNISISQSGSHSASVSLSTALSQLRNKRPNKDGESVQPKKVALSPSNTKR